MNTFKQTWWDLNLNSKMDTFKQWIGDYTAESKVLLRNYIRSRGYKSIVDFGCGVATEYFGYKNDGYDIDYLGVDSSLILFNKNTEAGVPMIHSDIVSTPLKDGQYEVSFSRHVWEHQPTYKRCLDEMIRVASKEVIHIFFIKPSYEYIDYNPSENLYHNRYSKNEIEAYCLNNPKVKSIHWEDVNKDECVIFINLND